MVIKPTMGELALNEVRVMDDKGPGGAHHLYKIESKDSSGHVFSTTIGFQKGPRNDPSSQPGITDSDLLEIVKDRLECFQESPYKCTENQTALNHIEVALNALKERAEKRNVAGKLGTDKI